MLKMEGYEQKFVLRSNTLLNGVYRKTGDAGKGRHRICSVSFWWTTVSAAASCCGRLAAGGVGRGGSRSCCGSIAARWLVWN